MARLTMEEALAHVCLEANLNRNVVQFQNGIRYTLKHLEAAGLVEFKDGQWQVVVGKNTGTQGKEEYKFPWVGVKDKLPETKEYFLPIPVIVTHGQGVASCIYVMGKFKTHYLGAEIPGVTHWAYLPKKAEVE